MYRICLELAAIQDYVSAKLVGKLHFYCKYMLKGNHVFNRISIWNSIDFPCMEVVPDSGYFHREIVMKVAALLKAMKTEAFSGYLHIKYLQPSQKSADHVA